MRFTIILFFTLITQFAFSQETLVLGNNQKYIYYEIVKDSSKNAQDFLKRAQLFYGEKKNTEGKLKLVTDSALEANGVLVIDKTLLIASHPSGEVSYSLVLNVKDGRYRFWLTNFNYIPYIRDRYGNFVSKTSMGKPLETNPTALKTAEWNSIVTATTEKVKTFATSFKKYMMGNEVEIKLNSNPIEVVKKDW